MYAPKSGKSVNPDGAPLEDAGPPGSSVSNFESVVVRHPQHQAVAWGHLEAAPRLMGRENLTSTDVRVQHGVERLVGELVWSELLPPRGLVHDRAESCVAHAEDLYRERGLVSQHPRVGDRFTVVVFRRLAPCDDDTAGQEEPQGNADDCGCQQADGEVLDHSISVAF